MNYQTALIWLGPAGKLQPERRPSHSDGCMDAPVGMWLESELLTPRILIPPAKLL